MAHYRSSALVLGTALMIFGPLDQALAGEACGHVPAATIVDQVIASIAAGSGAVAGSTPSPVASSLSTGPIAKGEPPG